MGHKAGSVKMPNSVSQHWKSQGLNALAGQLNKSNIIKVDVATLAEEIPKLAAELAASYSNPEEAEIRSLMEKLESQLDEIRTKRDKLATTLGQHLASMSGLDEGYNYTQMCVPVEGGVVVLDDGYDGPTAKFMKTLSFITSSTPTEA